ncbi:hypothetical protein VTK56DRAFT_3731 [Thermocarpiscus australiensis]
MKSTALVAGLLASAALAQPHHHGHGHQHRRNVHVRHGKRDVVTETVFETVYETVTAIVDEHTTELILPSSKPTPTTSTTSTTAGPRPGQFFEHSETSSAAPATSQPPQVVAPPPPPPPPPVVQPSSSPAPSPSPSPAPAPAPAPSSSSPPAPTQDDGSGGSSGGNSASGNSAPSSAYEGDLTFFALGLGSCGFDDSGKDLTDNIVAVSSALMGGVSNGNPMCGKTITVTANGKSVQATVHDKCPSCARGDIDASEKMFVELFGSKDVGRGKIKWWFNN